jgi:protease-4
VGVVKENRHLSESAPIDTMTDGRVFSGEAAQKLGLVDQVGLLPDAIDMARQMANATKAPRSCMYKRPYGYSGSIYASSPVPSPRADVMKLQLPGSGRVTLPRGFYYLWQP